MGNADSKAAGNDGESTVVTDIPGKTSTDSETNKSSERRSKSEGNNNNNKSPRRNRPRNSSGGDSSHHETQSRDDDILMGASERIRDEQINVNLAMADLMAYLQVVANNSNHLPVTRRDDPELDRTVSTLTSEEYARKSAAFVPADIRVIGGTFTRYGRVWDLPTSEVRIISCETSLKHLFCASFLLTCSSVFVTGIQCMRWSSRARTFLRWCLQ